MDWEKIMCKCGWEIGLFGNKEEYSKSIKNVGRVVIVHHKHRVNAYYCKYSVYEPMTGSFKSPIGILERISEVFLPGKKFADEKSLKSMEEEIATLSVFQIDEM